MKLLITGANGLLGQKLVALLTQTPGIDLVATARGQNRLPTTDGYTYQRDGHYQPAAGAGCDWLRSGPTPLSTVPP